MDIATVVGVVICIVLVLASMVLGGNPIMFVNIPSALVVIGGTIGATLVRNPLASVLGAVGIVMKTINSTIPDPSELNAKILEMSKTARKEGMLALESVQIDYEFLSKGVSLCVDGVEIDTIRAILQTDIDNTTARHKRGVEILEGAGQAAPAFGMIGTLIGLVQMLAALDDPAAIGPAMAVALLTTLYGALISNVICLPMADKLKVRSAEEELSMSLCLEGIAGIASGVHPASIDHQLKAFIPPSMRTDEAA